MGYFFVIIAASETVFRRKKSADLDARRQHQINVPLSFAVQSGVIRDQTHAPSLEFVKPPGGENIQARERPSVAGYGPTRVGDGFVVPREADAGEVDTERGGCNRSHAPAQRRDGGTPLGVDTVRQKDDIGFRLGVDPERRAGEAGVAERAHGKQLASVAGVRRIDIPAESPQDGLESGRLRRGHLAHACLAQDTHTGSLAQAKDHLGVARKVIGGRKQAGVAGESLHGPRHFIVDDSAQRFPETGRPLRRSDAGDERSRRHEHGVRHAKRFIDPLTAELGKVVAANPAHDLTQQDVVDIAVNEALSRRCDGLLRQSLADPGSVSSPRRLDVQRGTQA